MRAIVFTDYQTFPELREVERPTPGPGEVLLKVAGAGACHSDVGLFAEFQSDPTGLLTPPFVLGHETSGWIEELGPGVTGLEKGDAYLVYGPIGCGRCPACSRGQDTYCAQPQTVGYAAAGLGRDGGMAEYLAVPARNLVPLGDADPVAAAPLADAGLTPYHAIKRVLPHLDGGGRTALVIGLGGLGLVAVQILRALTGATVIATDSKPAAMAAAEELGAVTVPSGEGQVERIRELTGGRGVDAVFDIVGVDATMQLAGATVAQRGSVTIVGIGGGTFPWNFFTVPYEVNFSSTYWGTIEDLHEVVAMYRAGQITPAIERYSLDDGLEAYRRLRDGELDARAVIVPHES
ncbi:Alcohol dehydrogenase [Serinicoccus hydrothermalis]|uniref:Alcohol dehydrogenase n=1 Tax=Serinicoccus hydrothermalis TaxID=1758689 RepID=A0A1B1N9B7_9MICO|nr:NAD(P)-dependent alcohol dehydrogenase [Serinicoccus hydrothermalis]ANS78019.1 Alcohol dehydrogenase [Serinicoccus hydrothermalis]